MANSEYSESVFINCPFDTDYVDMLDALVFAVHDCGFVARCALEVEDASESRLTKILKIIKECRFGIHDISRTQLDAENQLPRFNMPLELGIFLGAKAYGTGAQRKKVCLVLDTERYRFQKFCSDIAGQDPSAHGGEPKKAIKAVRRWLQSHTTASVPGELTIASRYEAFRLGLPDTCRAAGLDPHGLAFVDYSAIVVEWLRLHSVSQPAST